MLSALVLSNENRLPAIFAGGSSALFRTERMSPPMLVATNVGINSAEYWISNCPQIEYIRLNYSSGKVANVNVTADSLIAMIYDVVKTIF